MGSRDRARHRPLVSVIPATALVVAAACSTGACSTGYGRDEPAPSPTITVAPVLDNPILAPPPTFPPLPTTVAGRPRPVIIPRDPYAPEPVREIGTIEIPVLGLVHPIYRGVTLHNIDRGPSHWPGTAEPGRPGNTVFAGHRVTNSQPFRDIDALAPGDEVVFTVEGRRWVYEVTGNMVVTPDDTWIADQTHEATGTLYACHPPGSLAYRFVVKLALVGE